MKRRAIKPEDEELPVVDQNDRLIATATRKVVHQNHYLHRAVHILILTSGGELLIQKRTTSKDRYPGYWDISAGGHVHVGESYEAAARRELMEELGICTHISPVTKLTASAETDWEHIMLFEATYDGPIKANPQEIQTWQFVHPGTIAKEMAHEFHLCTPALRHAISLLLDRNSSRQCQSRRRHK
jgi:isopentenyl-diphosphate delta-isomerase